MDDMLIKTRYFGEIDLTEDKIIYFENGLMGFRDYKKFTLLFDVEDGKDANIMWLQSVEEENLALPVVNPYLVKEDYNPEVEDEWLTSLGELTEENICILLTITVPKDNVKGTTANLKAPLIINSDTRKGCQLIVENKDYEIRYNVYEATQNEKKRKGEK